MPIGEGRPRTVDPGVRTWSEYQAALSALNRGGARWQLVPAHEARRLRELRMPAANLSFLPWVRQGAAGAIATVDTLGPQQAAVADLSDHAQRQHAPVPAVPVRLRGPADVVGIDAHQIVRMDPRPNTSDFEPNCFPSIEFDRADFPWLFTPARANANAQLRPWLCLVVVRKQDGVQLTSTVDSPLPVLQIAAPAKPVRRAAGSERLLGVGTRAGRRRQQHRSRRGEHRAERRAAAVAVAAGVPALAEANTDYIACVVPTFELGARPVSACRSLTASSPRPMRSRRRGR